MSEESFRFDGVISAFSPQPPCRLRLLSTPVAYYIYTRWSARGQSAVIVAVVLRRPVVLLRLGGVVVEEAEQVGERRPVDRVRVPALQHDLVHLGRTVEVPAGRTRHPISGVHTLQRCCTVHTYTHMHTNFNIISTRDIQPKTNPNPSPNHSRVRPTNPTRATK